MDLFNRDELKRLAQSDDGLCISIYMPTHRFRSDWSQNTTRFKNLLRDVRDQGSPTSTIFWERPASSSTDPASGAVSVKGSRHF